MAAFRRVLLVSDDLMFQSRIAAAVEATGGILDCAGRDDAGERAPGADAVFVDLNTDTAHRLGLIAELREREARQTIVAFCSHGDDETRIMAMRVGASSCVTNGALSAVALRLAGGTVPQGERR